MMTEFTANATLCDGLVDMLERIDGALVRHDQVRRAMPLPDGDIDFELIQLQGARRLVYEFLEHVRRSMRLGGLGAESVYADCETMQVMDEWRV